jgi:hypothetical protein
VQSAGVLNLRGESPEGFPTDSEPSPIEKVGWLVFPCSLSSVPCSLGEQPFPIQQLGPACVARNRASESVLQVFATEGNEGNEGRREWCGVLVQLGIHTTAFVIFVAFCGNRTAGSSFRSSQSCAA